MSLDGGFHGHEAVGYRQFRWLPDALAAGPAHALGVAAESAWRWMGIAPRQLAAPAIVLGALLVVGRVIGTPLRGLASRQSARLTAAATVLVLGLAFWYLNGSMSGGRAATLAPVVQAVGVAVALDLDHRADRARWTTLLAALSLAWGLGTLLGSPLF